MGESALWAIGGIGFGFCLGCFWNSMMYRSILISKANDLHRTAEKIGDGFYYIVPEKEYVEMSIASLPQRAAP